MCCLKLLCSILDSVLSFITDRNDFRKTIWFDEDMRHANITWHCTSLIFKTITLQFILKYYSVNVFKGYRAIPCNHKPNCANITIWCDLLLLWELVLYLAWQKLLQNFDWNRTTCYFKQSIYQLHFNPRWNELLNTYLL